MGTGDQFVTVSLEDESVFGFVNRKFLNLTEDNVILNIHLWGANKWNWALIKQSKFRSRNYRMPSGAGQALSWRKNGQFRYGPGVFGINTMPNTSENLLETDLIHEEALRIVAEKWPRIP